jgi:hypothetical protein
MVGSNSDCFLTAHKKYIITFEEANVEICNDVPTITGSACNQHTPAHCM